MNTLNPETERTECEKRFRAAGLCAEARHGEHLLQGHVAAAAPHRRLRKGAVAAAVAAQVRKRDEDLHSHRFLLL